MTAQEIFDRVWEHFIVQRRPYAMAGPVCRYRDDAGNACAIGIFIPDELYDPIIEGESVNTLDEYLLREVFPGLDVSDAMPFLKKLQFAHDTCGEISADVEHFAAKLRDVAWEYSLRVPAVSSGA